jgi:mRNA interferase YafQ
MLIISYTSNYKSSLEKHKISDRFPLSKLIQCIDLLASGAVLPISFRDHSLHGTLSDCRECHIDPDMLLIYRKDDIFLKLVNLGSYSDLF